MFQEMIKITSKVLDNPGEGSEENSEYFLKIFGAYEGSLGPALSILNIFLEDRQYLELPASINKFDQVYIAMSNKFQDNIENDSSNFLQDPKDLTSILNSHTSKLMINRKSSLSQGLVGPAIKTFFFYKMKQEMKVNDVKIEINKLSNLMSMQGSTRKK
jgi:hypothetical protein